MQATSGNTFDLLVKPVRRLVEQKGFPKPTEPQEKTIPKVLDGKNVLLISPTATGKTEAAFLPVLSMLLQAPKTPGIKVLYITPLRALNRDMLERLQWWCNNLDIKLQSAMETQKPKNVQGNHSARLTFLLLLLKRCRRFFQVGFFGNIAGVALGDN